MVSDTMFSMRDVEAVLKLHEDGILSDAQVVAVLKIETGIKERSGESRIIGTAIELVAKGKMDPNDLVAIVDAFADDNPNK